MTHARKDGEPDRRYRDPDDKRTCQVNFRLSPRELQSALDLCEGLDIQPGTVARDLLLKKIRRASKRKD